MKKLLLPILLIALATFLTYANILSAEFLEWDDTTYISNNYIIRNFSPVIFWTYDPELYIPITFLSYQIEHALFGLNPFWFHLTSLIIHTLNAILVFWLSLHLTKKKLLAVFAALIFAVHPINIEAVAWISARKEVLSALFMLLSFMTYLKANNRRWMIVLSLVLFVFAMMSKVTAIVLPAILILHQLTQPKTNNQKPITYLPYLILALIFGVIALIGKSAVIEQLGFFQIILLAFRSLTFYLQKFLVPINFSAIYPAPNPITLTNPEIYISILIVIGLGIVLWFFRKNKTAIFASGFALLTMAPSFLAYMRSDGISVGADRYAYMPSIGFSILLVLIISSLRKKEVVYFILCLIIVACTVITINRQKVWANTEVLFLDVIEKNPESHIANNNIGNMYLYRGEPDRARAHFYEALRIKPDYPDALVNMAAYLGLQGNLDAAEKNLIKALELQPNNYNAHFNLAGVHFMREEYEKALDEYKKTIEINTYYVPALWQLARTYLAVGDEERARAMYEVVLEMDGSYEGRRSEMDELLK